MLDGLLFLANNQRQGYGKGLDERKGIEKEKAETGSNKASCKEHILGAPSI